MRELIVQKQILKAWGAHPRIRIARVNTGVGWFNDAGPCRRSDRGARPVRFNPPGTADIVGIIAPEGRMLMVEVKSERGTQSAEQKTMQRVITEWGGIYVVARSVDDVDAVLATLGIRR